VAFSFVGLIVLVLAIGVVVFVFGRGFSAMVGLFKSVQGGHATLMCPHCGKETPAVAGRCQSCGQDL
jgi:hypothetical protein